HRPTNHNHPETTNGRTYENVGPAIPMSCDITLSG
ncbi:hypothetical protein M2316_004129, partial [Cellulosimicrobium cellulans]|nr:hypothetical protein [Cellulosimicrobium cellulans]